MCQNFFPCWNEMMLSQKFPLKLHSHTHKFFTWALMVHLFSMCNFYIRQENEWICKPLCRKLHVCEWSITRLEFPPDTFRFWFKLFSPLSQQAKLFELITSVKVAKKVKYFCFMLHPHTCNFLCRSLRIIHSLPIFFTLRQEKVNESISLYVKNYMYVNEALKKSLVGTWYSAHLNELIESSKNKFVHVCINRGLIHHHKCFKKYLTSVKKNT